MKKALLIVLFMIMMPLASAQFGEFTTENKIIVVAGDSSEGSIILTNALNSDFKVVSFIKFIALDDNNKEVQGFSFELIPDKTGEWRRKENKTFYYKLTTNESVNGGSYTLELTLWGFTQTGDLYIITSRIPVEVIEKPLKLLDIGSYVEGKPQNISYVLNGETIVAYAHIKNFKSSPVMINATAQLLKGDKIIMENKKTFNVSGNNYLVKNELKIPYNLPEGEYKVRYILSYPEETFTFSKDYFVTFGVKISSISLEAKNILEGENNEVYIDVISDRNLNAEIALELFDSNESLLTSIKNNVKIAQGSNRFTFNVPAPIPGKIKVKATLSYGDVVLGEAEDEFLSIAFPSIENITIVTHDDVAIAKLEIVNPNNFEIASKVMYSFYVGDSVLKREKLELQLKKGTNEIEIILKVPLGEVINYEIYLEELGKRTQKTGSFKIELPPSTTTTTTVEPTTSSTAANTTTTHIGDNEENNTGKAVLVVLLITIVLIAAYIMYSPKESKKRKRPKPKRKSPLGRFKRPKIPKFREFKNIPKKKS
ncbi:hypothetical protein PAP_09450 [Palaeococcus pacificus DY20341]|uniref:Uncharacterized protein n=1 Tax=Palaeococcus pacificus DY20341 TaxID=1343739 RepID=A0A075LVR9_9EURY|nr:hypothetical protein [Palaeococcus pacificus]AIF70266.1 hypothetical protein PAP_09450 [Palaeococcus pacificus DY20341]